MIHLRTIRTAVIILTLAGAAWPLTASRLCARENEYFYLQRPQLGLNLTFKTQDEERKNPFTDTTTTEKEFRERLSIETKGWIYHPNLMIFHLTFEPQWQQDAFQLSQMPMDSTQSHTGDSVILNFDADTTLLRNKPFSINLFANRKSGQIDFSKAPKTEIDSETWGTRLNFTHAVLPATLTLMHRRQTQSGYYSSREDRDEAQLTIRHLAKKSVTRFNLSDSHADKTTTASFGDTQLTLKTTSTELTNAFFITDDGRVKLDSRLYAVQADYGGIDHDTWMLSQSLWWPQTQNLLTRFRWDYSRREFGESVNEETRLGAVLTHHLLDRLTTDLKAEAAMDNFTAGRENLYLGGLGLRYCQPIPHGRIELGSAFDYTVTNRSGGENIIPTDMTLTLTAGVDTYLERENVVTESIVVTDATGTVIYALDIDYLVETTGTQVRISRTLTGAITDGQQVVVRYNYRQDAGYNDARFGQNYNLTLALWSFLYGTYDHSRVTQSIESGTSPDVPLDDTTDTVSTSVVFKWSDTQLLYQRRDRVNGNSTDTRSLHQQFHFKPANNFFLNFSGKIGRTDYPDTDEAETFYTLGTSIGWTPKWWCNVSLNGQRSTISRSRPDLPAAEDAIDTQIAAVVRFTYGVWTASATYRLRDQEDQRMDDNFRRQEILISLSRRLW